MRGASGCHQTLHRWARRQLQHLKQSQMGIPNEQILIKHPGLTYLDIFSAARDALDIIGASSKEAAVNDTPKAGGKTLDEYQKADPRAYEKWTEEEEDALLELMKIGHTIRSTADLLQRKPSAIRSRLDKLKALSTD